MYKNVHSFDFCFSLRNFSLFFGVTIVFPNENDSDFDSIYDEDDVDSESQVQEEQAIIVRNYHCIFIHPKFDIVTNNNDIALVRLKTPLQSSSKFSNIFYNQLEIELRFFFC